MKLSAILAPLIAAKASHATIMDVVLAFEAEQVDALAKRRESDAKRQASKRERDASHVMSRDVTVTVPSRTRVEGSSSKEEISGKENKRGRATRLPADWVLPDDWLQKALSEGMTRQAALASAERMKNWSLSAKDGAKIDWHPTWLNWFRRDLAKATAPPDKPKKVTVASMWRDEGRKAGLLPNEPPLEINGRMDAGHGNGPAPSTNLARRIASAGSG